MLILHFIAILSPRPDWSTNLLALQLTMSIIAGFSRGFRLVASEASLRSTQLRLITK